MFANMFLTRGTVMAITPRVSVRHGLWCPGLATQSTLLCECRPEIIIVEVPSGDNGSE
jgi:hypothetical protein